jgi:hypothetical protein
MQASSWQGRHWPPTSVTWACDCQISSLPWVKTVLKAKWFQDVRDMKNKCRCQIKCNSLYVKFRSMHDFCYSQARLLWRKVEKFYYLLNSNKIHWLEVNKQWSKIHGGCKILRLGKFYFMLISFLQSPKLCYNWCYVRAILALTEFKGNITYNVYKKKGEE